MRYIIWYRNYNEDMNKLTKLLIPRFSAVITRFEQSLQQRRGEKPVGSCLSLEIKKGVRLVLPSWPFKFYKIKKDLCYKRAFLSLIF